MKRFVPLETRVGNILEGVVCPGKPKCFFVKILAKHDGVPFTYTFCIFKIKPVPYLHANHSAYIQGVDEVVICITHSYMYPTSIN